VTRRALAGLERAFHDANILAVVPKLPSCRQGWLDGARVRSVFYLPFTSTEPASWRPLLVGRFGVAARDSNRTSGEGLHAIWCEQNACSGEGGGFSLVADKST
jgi:hypothetical protein